MDSAPATVDVCTHASPVDFLEQAGPMLLAEEALNSLPLGLADALHQGRRYGDEEPLLLTLRRGGDVVGVALQTPPHSLLLSRLEPTVSDALADWCAERATTLPGVNAECTVAERFARRYAALTGKHTAVSVRTRLFEVRQVIHPEPPPGSMRRAAATDRELVQRWYDDFHDEAMPNAPARITPDHQLDNGNIWLWVDAPGQPVCLAARNREQPNGASIGPVYTPPGFRGRGYATALVAGLSQLVLDDGNTYCCLFTDLANPTSNAIYPRVGYEPIADMTTWSFTDSIEPPG